MAYLATEPDINRPLTHQVPGINHIAYAPDGVNRVISDVRMNVSLVTPGGRMWTRNLGSKSDKVRPTERIRGLCISADARRVFVAAADTVYALDFASGEIVWKYEPPRSWGFLIISPIALAYSPNGEVAASFDNGSFTVWDEQGQVKKLWQDNDAPRQLAYQADGQTLVGSDSFSLCAWDVSTRKRTLRIPLQDRAFCFAASPVAPVAVTRTLHHVVVWDLEPRKERCRLAVEPGLPLVEFHPSGEMIAISSKGGIRLLDLELNEIGRIPVEDANILSIAFSPSGKEVSLGLSNDELRTIQR